MEQEASQYFQSKTETSATNFDELPEKPLTPLHIFVLGPSQMGKSQLIKLFSDCNPLKLISHNTHEAYRLEGVLLKGINAQINMHHINDMDSSLDFLRSTSENDKTSIVVVYDDADITSFDITHCILNLLFFVNYRVPIVLVGFEDSNQVQTPELSSESNSFGWRTKLEFDLAAFRQLSDKNASSVKDFFFEAANIALESNLPT